MNWAFLLAALEIFAIGALFGMVLSSGRATPEMEERP